ASRLQAKAVWAGDMVDWTVDAVLRERFDLVVKTGNRSENLFYTPTDWQLLRRCPAPVMIASSRSRRKGRSILAAIDAGSTHPIQIALNRKVLGAAAQLGKLWDMQVHAAHVIAVSAVAKDLDLFDTRALEREQRRKLSPLIAAMADEH